MKKIEINQTIRTCPECGWKPDNKEGSAMYGDLIEHVMKAHNMGKPYFTDRTIFVKDLGEQKLEVAIFTRHSANPMGPLPYWLNQCE
jgi:hypothetical protein